MELISHSGEAIKCEQQFIAFFYEFFTKMVD